MISLAWYAGIVALVVVGGLVAANILYDRGIPQYLSRKVGHFAAGIAFIIAVALFPSGWWPLALAVVFSLLLLLARLFRPATFRGVGGSGRAHARSEVYFSLVLVPVIAIAWLYLDRPDVTLASLLFMAWGDGVTGLARARMYGGPGKGLWGSAAMAATCLAIAAVLVRPFWVGVAGAATAVALERVSGAGGLIEWADDNWTVALGSMGMMLALGALAGSL